MIECHWLESVVLVILGHKGRSSQVPLINAIVMSGRGKGGPKRHRKALRGNFEGEDTKPAINRSARREGVKNISSMKKFVVC